MKKEYGNRGGHCGGGRSGGRRVRRTALGVKCATFVRYLRLRECAMCAGHPWEHQCATFVRYLRLRECAVCAGPLWE